MAITYGFYNSVAGDRVYDALQVSQMFNGVLTDGVFKLVGNKFQVIQNAGMNIFVRSGKAWFNNTWTFNDGDIALTVSDADLVLPRIDTVVLEVDSSLSIRANTIKMVEGTPHGTPVPPTLVNTLEVNQYPLAYIMVGVGVTSIVNDNITQVVGTVDCPFITFPEPAVVDGDAADVLKVQIFT
jgi:hypothetical protein